MIVSLGGDGHGVEACGGRFVVAEPGAGGGHLEDLDDLGAQAASELPPAAQSVLAGYPALLMRGRAERQVGFAQQPVVGDDAVSGGEHVGQAGPHRSVDRDGLPAAGRRAGRHRECRIGPDPGADQDHVGEYGRGLPVAARCVDAEPAGR